MRRFSRLFDFEGSTVCLVPSRAVHPVGSEAHAAQVVAQVEADLGLDELRSWLPEAEGPRSEAQVRAQAQALLSSGELTLLCHGLDLGPLDAPETTDLVDLLPPVTPLQSDDVWFEVHCTGPGGESYAHAKARVRLPDGTDRFVTLGPDSRLRIDDLPESGRCEFELSADARATSVASPPLDTAIPLALGSTVLLPTERTQQVVVRVVQSRLRLQVVDEAGSPWPEPSGSVQDRQGTTHTLAFDTDSHAELELSDDGEVRVSLKLGYDG